LSALTGTEIRRLHTMSICLIAKTQNWF